MSSCTGIGWYIHHCKEEIGGTLMLTHYTDDWVAVWNGNPDRQKSSQSALYQPILKLKAIRGKKTSSPGD